METYRCGRCKTIKTAEEFNASQRANGKWCVACYQEWYRSRYTPRTISDDKPRACAQCGVMYSPKQRRVSIYCSRECKTVARLAALAAELEATKPVRSCVWCGADMPRSMRADAKFCSRQCSQLRHRQTVKIRYRTGLRTTAVTLNEIAVRDKYRCGICGGRVDMKLTHPDPMFGSLDHIIPLSQGGDHVAANLQLAHLRCNLSKGDRGGTDQLRLI